MSLLDVDGAAPALEATRRACRIARRLQGRLDELVAITKDDRSPVTIADLACQAVVIHALQDSLGSFSMIAEESSKSLERDEVRAAVVDALREDWPDVTDSKLIETIDAGRHTSTSGVVWTLDPIDGTKGFLRGQQYCISLARLEDGVVTLGFLGCPNLPRAADVPLDRANADGAIYGAARGHGSYDATDELRAIRASETSETITFCESVEAAHSDHSQSQAIIEHVGLPAKPPVRLDSQCKYAVVARGQADAYLRLPKSATYVEKIWDHAAGSLVATEAGAVVSDVSGNPLDFSHGARLEQNKGVVVAAPALHRKLIEAVGAVTTAG